MQRQNHPTILGMAFLWLLYEENKTKTKNKTWLYCRGQKKLKTHFSSLLSGWVVICIWHWCVQSAGSNDQLEALGKNLFFWVKDSDPDTSSFFLECLEQESPPVILKVVEQEPKEAGILIIKLSCCIVSNVIYAYSGLFVIWDKPISGFLMWEKQIVHCRRLN